MARSAALYQSVHSLLEISSDGQSHDNQGGYQAFRRLEDSDSCRASQGVQTAESLQFESALINSCCHNWLLNANWLDELQVELMGQCPPIEKMDATLSTLKACVCVSLDTVTLTPQFE